MTPLTYPITRTVDVVDDYHGTLVADPYRWLEDLDSEETAAWVREQNALTFSYLETLPHREPLRARLTELWDYDKVGAPFKAGGRYFVMRNDGLQNQYVLWTMDSLDGEQRVLLDPNTWSDDGTVALVGVQPTRDGSLLAYGVASAGSDWVEWRVVDVATGADLDDRIRWVKFSGVAWLPDNSGFYYSRYDENDRLQAQNLNQKLYFHRLGREQSDDDLVYERPDQPEWGFAPTVTEDGRFLCVTIWKGSDPKNGFLYRAIGAGETSFTALLTDFDADYRFVGNDGGVFYFVTDREAPRARLIAIDIADPAPSQWSEVIAESTGVLQSVSLKGDRFIASYLVDAHTQVKRFRLDGTYEGDVDLPGLGTVVGFGGRRDENEAFFTFTSFTEPATIYRYDVAADTATEWRRSGVAFDPSGYETQQIFYTSKDGTRVPMFLVHRKGLELDGRNPTILYGYGGFAVSQVPAFSLVIATWLELGGVFAVANLRGGGEYGEEWHRAGCKDQKQNVFDDFIAAAEWLIENRYTSSSRLAIQGGSNGGLLTAACMTQRPELFGAVLIGVGVLDMLRFHRFTIGWAWKEDYGCADDPEDFKYLYAYSPLHTLKPGTAYPATLVTTADHDDRVVPSHSFKFISALQAAQGGTAQVLIRVDVKAGHGVGKPTSKVIEQSADQLAFVLASLGVQDPAGDRSTIRS